MFTDCPSCHRQFRLRAYQLSAAGGQVQCGYCGRQFNALERLHDQPLPRSRRPVPVIADEAAEEAVVTAGEEEISGFELPEEETGTESSAAADAVPDSEAETEPVASPGAGVNPPQPPLTAPAAEPMAEEEGEEEDEREEASAQVPPEVVDSEATTELPPPLQEEEPPRRSRTARVLWGLAAVLVLLIGAAQLAWFNRDVLLSRYPQLMPWARQVCEYFQCQVIRHRDASAIKLLNRDVRDHPRYDGALLVNATIANELPTIQPYPVVQFVLFDTNGKIIGQRKFKPAEYLDDSINIDQGMPPGQPVHIVLEVTGPTQGAVSFEFRFIES